MLLSSWTKSIYFKLQSLKHKKILFFIVFKKSGNTLCFHKDRKKKPLLKTQFPNQITINLISAYLVTNPHTQSNLMNTTVIEPLSGAHGDAWKNHNKFSSFSLEEFPCPFLQQHVNQPMKGTSGSALLSTLSKQVHYVFCYFLICVS